MGIVISTSDFSGLAADMVLQSREQNGSNALTKRRRKSIIKSFLSNFGDPMIKVLLIALGIQIVFLFGSANLLETFGIAAAILVAVIVSTVSEMGSEAAFEKLQATAANIECRVRRGGMTVKIPVSELVVGDIVLLGAGDKISADGIILQGSLEVDQSLLNGESKESSKVPNGGLQKLSISAANNSQGQKTDFLNPVLLFSGSVVTNGEAVMQVTTVGDKTVYGKIAAELQDTTPKSPLKVKLEGLAKMISFIGYIGAAMVAFAYLFNNLLIDNNFNWEIIGKQVTDFNVMFPHLINAATLVVSVIVMAVPEGLPMMITVVLSRNVKYMLRDNVLVRQLGGIETAGSMNILFTDKTGTLTHGKLEVVGVVTGDGTLLECGVNDKRGVANQVQFSQTGIAKIMSTALRFNTSAEISGERAVGGNSTDRILLEFAHKLPSSAEGIKKIKTIPFSSANKFMSTLVSGFNHSAFSTQNMSLIKGAPELLLKHCTRFWTTGGAVRSLHNKDIVNKVVEKLSASAIRFVAVAVSCDDVEVPKDSLPVFGDLVLVGLVAVRDKVRTEAAPSVARLKSAGVQVVMITGDAKSTAMAVAKETGILSMDSGELVLTSEELNRMSDTQLAAILPRVRVVARALPSDKSRLVRISQSLNLVTGMTGDGVNDAPALKKSDIGFAMGSGTEVAKEAGDIVIMDDNISSISRAISYGRTVFKSIRKFLIFKLTINFCAMSVSIIAPLLNVDTPITVLQMLWINLVMDTLAGLAFGGERPRVAYMSEPPKKRDEPIINRYMWQQILVASIWTSFIALWFLKSKTVQHNFMFESAAYAMTAFFTFFMFMSIFNSFNARTHKMNLLDYLSLNKPFIWIMGAVGGIQILMTFLGGSIFRTEPISVSHFLLIILLAATVIPVDLIRKLITRRKGEIVTT